VVYRVVDIRLLEAGYALRAHNLKLCSLQKREEQAQRMKKYKEAIVQKDIGDRIVF